MRLVLFLLILSPSLFAAQYVYINSIDSDFGTFNIRKDKLLKVYPSMKAFFTSENTSVLARLEKMDGSFLTWRIDNQAINKPFKEGDVVMMEGYETMLTRKRSALTRSLMREVRARRLNLKTTMAEKKRHGFIAKGSYATSVTETYTPLNAGDIQSSYGLTGEFSYLFPMSRNFFFAPTASYSRNELSFTDKDLSNTQTKFLAQFVLYLPDWEAFKTSIPYITFGIGAGVSSSDSDIFTEQTEGHVIILPQVTAGLLFPFKNSQSLGFSIDLGFNAASIREQNDTLDNNANLSELIISMGVHKFFGN